VRLGGLSRPARQGAAVFDHLGHVALGGAMFGQDPCAGCRIGAVADSFPDVEELAAITVGAHLLQTLAADGGADRITELDREIGERPLRRRAASPAWSAGASDHETA